ncbi:MAG TPA: hypothetical protein VD978_11545 [Azospirillum sp.]|nr:hypothetical protein [Azospirillum sp.]
MTRDDFPYSLQAYATPSSDGDAPDCHGWSLFLYRATDDAERAWLLANGFTLQGRQWVRAAPASEEPEPVEVST